MESGQLWTIASAIGTRYRQSSFGGGVSSDSDRHGLGWDRVNNAFFRDDLYGVGSGNPTKRTMYPCDKGLAEAILQLCMTEEVRKQFFCSLYDEEEYTELFMCEGRMVCFYRRGAIRGHGTSYLALASFSFQFYGPDWTLHHVGLGPHLTQQLEWQLRKLNVTSLQMLLSHDTIAV